VILRKNDENVGTLIRCITDGKIQYAMNYLGRVLEQQFSGDFLKEALRKADKKCHTGDRSIISQVNIHINAALPEIFSGFRDMKRSIATP